MSIQPLAVRDATHQPLLDYEHLTWDDVQLSAWAMNLVIAAGSILRDLPD